MKNIYYIFLILFFVLLNKSSIQAQDATYMQFFNNKLHLNPAFTGFEHGLVVSSIYRTQWHRIGGELAKFKTESVGLSTEIRTPHSSIGIGGLYTGNTEAIGLKNNSFGILYAFRVKLSKKVELGLGLKTSWVWRSIDWENLIFSDQLHPIDGLIIGSQSNILPDNLFTEKKNFDLDIGSIIDIDFTKSTLSFLRESSLRFGIAINHIRRPPTSLVELNDRLGPRISLHSTWIKNLNNSRSSNIITVFKADWQKSRSIDPFWFQQIDFGFIFNGSNPQYKNPALFGGVLYHTSKIIFKSISKESVWSSNTNAVTLLLGIKAPVSKKNKKSAFIVTGSHSIDFSGLVNTGGITEISLRVNINHDHIQNCKRNPRAGTSVYPF